MIKKELNRAIIKSMTGKYVLYIFQLLSLSIISRLFTPEMFGTLALLQVFILFFQLIATSSLAPAIVYKETLIPKERDGIFSVTLIIGSIFTLIFYLVTPYLTLWLNLVNIDLVTAILSVNVFFSALSMLPMAALQKDTKFLTIARAEIIAELLSLSLCLYLYYKGFGIMALASKLVMTPMARFIFYYISSSKTSIGRPKLGTNLKAISTIIGVAKYQLAFNILNFFSRNLDTLLITKYFGVSTVGIYEKSYQVMRYPLQLFTFAINPALQPILTKFKKEPQVVEREFYRLIFKLSFLGVFISFVLFWATPNILLIMFGPQWYDATNILRVLSVTIPLQMVLSSTGGVFQAFGATKKMFKCGAFSSVTNVAAISLGILSQDILNICFYLTISLSLNFFQCFWILHRHVFRHFSLSLFIQITILIFINYINLIFIDIPLKPTLNYYQSVILITKLSLITFIVLAFFYGICRIATFRKN